MRLIDADMLKTYVNSKSTHLLCEWSTIGVLEAIDKTPTVESLPLSDKHCSECGSEYVYLACNNCGAAMSLEASE